MLPAESKVKTEIANDDFQKQLENYEFGIFRSETSPKASLEYLQELLKDKKQLSPFQTYFSHVDRLLESEISKVRIELFHINHINTSIEETLPEPQGETVSLSKKVFIPVKENPSYNFVGRLLGPGGMTAKHMEKCLGCKIMIRGQGSMRDKKKEELNRGKPNWEHLNEELHVLITVEDTQNRAEMKINKAVEEITKFLDEAIKTPEGEDDIKKRQLMELALINGTYRDMTQGGFYGYTFYDDNFAKASKAYQQNLLSASSLNPYLRNLAAVPTLQPGYLLGNVAPPIITPASATSRFPTALSAVMPSTALFPSVPVSTDPTTAALLTANYPGNDYLLASSSSTAQPVTVSTASSIDYNSIPGLSLDPGGPVKGYTSDVRTHPYARKT